MVYDPTSFYPMGYDSHSMHTGGYTDPTNMYLPQASSSITPNASEVEFNIIIFLILFFFYLLISTNKKSMHFFVIQHHLLIKKMIMVINPIEQLIIIIIINHHHGIVPTLANIVVRKIHDYLYCFLVFFLYVLFFLNVYSVIQRKIYPIKKN